MTAKPVVPRELAHRDIEEAIDHYTDEAGADVALRFIDAPRYAHGLELLGLRSRKLRKFPYLVFYLERGDHIDVWRVLHAQRDIPSLMAD